MAVAQKNPLESLSSVLDNLVEDTPAAKALGLIRIVPFARAFGLHRATIQRDVARGYLVATQFNQRVYFSKQAILDWYEAAQRRPSPYRYPKPWLRKKRVIRSQSTTGVSA